MARNELLYLRVLNVNFTKIFSYNSLNIKATLLTTINFD